MAKALTQMGHLFQVTQLPGDVVFVPHNWYHATIYFADTVSYSQEFCSAMHSNARMQPLGSIVYGGYDERRGVGQYYRHSGQETRMAENIMDSGINLATGISIK